MAALRRITPRAMTTLAFGSISASYATLQSLLPGRGVIIFITNSLDKDTIISLDGGTTDFIQLPGLTNLTIDLGANGAEYSGTIQVKQGTGGAMASGFISCGVLRVL